MANTIDVTQAQYFIPEIWAQSAIPFLRANIVAASRIMQDSEVATFNVGDILHVPYPGTFTANDKSANAEYAIQQPSGETEVQLTLNQHRHVTFTLEDIVRAQANQDVLARYGEAAAIALAEDVETKVLAELVTGGASNLVGTYGTDLSAATLRSAWKTMTDNKAPQSDRNLVVSTKDQIALLADTGLTNYFAFNQTRAETAADLGDLYGFRTYSSQLVSAVAGTPISTKNIAWQRAAALIAYRGMPEPPAGTGALRANVRDDVSGIVISVLMGYDIRLGGVQVTYELLYGVKTLQGERIVLVRS